MPELESTINETPVESSTTEDDRGDLVSTTDAPSEETIKTEDKADHEDKGDKESKDETEKETEKETEETRFDKHPRFKALIEANREQRKSIAELMAKLDKPAKQESVTKKEDMFDMSDLDMADELTENPKEFLQKFAKNIESNTEEKMLTVFEKLHQEQQAETAEEANRKAYEEFGEKNAGFWEMWDSGEIKLYMDKNPAHNAMSAYQALTSDSTVQEQIDAAVKKAVEETTEKINKNIKAKRNVTFLPAGPTETGTQKNDAPELQDSKKHGGMTSVLMRRLQQRRNQA